MNSNATLATSSPGEFEPLLKPAQAAEFLGVTTAYIKDHCTRSRPFIPYCNLGTKKKAMRRFRRRDLVAFAEELQRHKSALK